MRALRSEGQPGEAPAVAAGFVFDARAAVEKALDQVRVRPFSLLEARKVGRKRQAGSVVGLLSHTAEHATRHIGQATTSAKVQRGGAAGQ